MIYDRTKVGGFGLRVSHHCKRQIHAGLLYVGFNELYYRAFFVGDLVAYGQLLCLF